MIGGFRYGSGTRLVGSLLLGLHDSEGLLRHVGFTSSIARANRPALTEKLEKLIAPPGFTGNAPRGPSRWNCGKDHTWQPLLPSLVVEICYDHVTGGRFRHGTKLLRWRPDKIARAMHHGAARAKAVRPLAAAEMTGFSRAPAHSAGAA